jgi:hypothetical protein
MRRLRPTDGTPAHRRAACFHMSKCFSGGVPLHATLHTEMSAKYAALKAKAREVEDAEDAATNATAGVELSEAGLENAIRDLAAELSKLDRSDPSLNAQKTVFPEGFGKEIEPEGREQLTVLTALRVRIDAFKANAPVAAALTRLESAEAAFHTALAAGAEAATKVEELFEEEQVARRAVREQLESAHGRLRDLYKAKPSLAEQFFLKNVPSRSPDETTEPGVAGVSIEPA